MDGHILTALILYRAHPLSRLKCLSVSSPEKSDKIPEIAGRPHLKLFYNFPESLIRGRLLITGKVVDHQKTENSTGKFC
jgi:hypothetical protein